MNATIAEQFRLIETEINGRSCKIFADTPACLSDLFTALDEFADREFILQAARRVSYADVRNNAATLAAYLSREVDITAASRVGIALPNSIEWCVAFIAVASLGATPVLINSRGAADELQHCLTSTDCDAWLGDALAVSTLTTASINPGRIPLVDQDRLQAVLSNPSGTALPRTRKLPHDAAILMFTSGTTGRARAAILTHIGLLTALKTIQYSGTLIASQMADNYGIDYDTLVSTRPPSVTLLAFPLFHVSGCHAVFLSSLIQGGKIVLMQPWDPDAALVTIAAEKITAFPGVPTMYRDLLKRAERSDADLSSLTSVSIGGQSTPPALLEAVHTAFPQAVLGTGYGMTETNGIVTLTVGDEFTQNPASTGQVVATIEAEIRGDTGAVLPAGEIGEVFVRGATLMAGYANATAPCFDEKGWFATGDIGLLDAEQKLYIVDRRTDMVISGGENIYCAEVERAIDLHPAVRECAAFGEPDDRLGERLVALATLEEGYSADSDEILAAVAEQLAGYKIPKHLLLTGEPLPRNPSGKIVKRQIRRLFERAKLRTPQNP